MRLLLLSAIVVFALASIAAKVPSSYSCFVSPDPAQMDAALGYASFTINAIAPAVPLGDSTLVNITDPNGIENYWSVENPTGSFVLPWQEHYLGTGQVAILQRKPHGSPRPVATCSFTVTN